MAAMKNTEAERAARWFVIANGSLAHAYAKRVGESGYDLVRSWDAPDARTKNADLGEDRPGRSMASAGSSRRSAMEFDGKDDSPKEHAKRDLAARIAADLAVSLRAGEVTSLAIIAPSPVATAIRTHLPKDLAKALAGEDHVDITHLPKADIFTRLDGFRSEA